LSHLLSKQRGPEAEKADNVFYHLSYYDSDDLAKIADESHRTEIELHIADFGSCPAQLFLQPHPGKKLDRKSQSELSLVKQLG
jgi:factor associated with neutral sphingomyelinase activation